MKFGTNCLIAPFSAVPSGNIRVRQQPQPKKKQTVVGFLLDREEPDSLPNPGKKSSANSPGMGGDVVRPGSFNFEAPRAIRRFAERKSKDRGAAVRAAAANGEASRLQRTFEEDGWIARPTVGTQVSAPDPLQGWLEAVLSRVEG